MPAKQLFEIAKAITGNAYMACAYYEMFVPPARRARLIKRVDKAKVNPGLNAVTDALHQSALTALCRIYDNTRGVASLVDVAKRLRQKTVVAALAAKGRHIRKTDLASFLRRIELISKSEQMRALRRARNLSLAHQHDPNLPLSPSLGRGAVYGDERHVLRATLPLVQKLNRWVGFDYHHVHKVRAKWRNIASDFWKLLAPASR